MNKGSNTLMPVKLPQIKSPLPVVMSPVSGVLKHHPSVGGGNGG